VALSGNTRLCYAGGVALNVTTNERLHRESTFHDIYIPAAAEDSGPAVGAAFHALWQITGRHGPAHIHTDSFGKSYSTQEIDDAIADTPGLRTVSTNDVLREAAMRLANGEIGGWFHGGAELGPRALGNRSILADPRDPETKTRLNAKVKFRQGFRPFAPAVLNERADAWFELARDDNDSEFMLRSWKVREHAKAIVPAVVHADGTGRAQTVDRAHLPRFHALISKFHDLTGVPMLVNTSFNVNKEPIVETPEDALWCFLFTGIDFCVLEDHLVVKTEGLAAVRNCRPRLIARGITTDGAALSANVDTPWGKQRVQLSAKVLPLLDIIDGKKRIADIADSLRRATTEPISDEALVELFASLRRLRVVSLSPR
jgi:carbamoyltransferase